jgi:hypothetical protein
MYRDKTLIPTEAIRLCALGALSEGPRRYGELAAAVRHFASRVMGASLDVFGSSIELLRLEGLVEPIDGRTEHDKTGHDKTAHDETAHDDATLRITEAGRAELALLLKSRVRSPVDDLNKLVTALKMRYLHLLPAAEQAEQMELLAESTEGEIGRLADLRSHHDAGLLADWLDHELAQLEARRAWFVAHKGGP